MVNYQFKLAKYRFIVLTGNVRRCNVSSSTVKDLYYARTYITRFTRKGNLRGIKVRAEIEALSFAH